jgi:hypothetical protein
LLFLAAWVLCKCHGTDGSYRHTTNDVIIGLALAERVEDVFQDSTILGGCCYPAS